MVVFAQWFTCNFAIVSEKMELSASRKDRSKVFIDQNPRRVFSFSFFSTFAHFVICRSDKGPNGSLLENLLDVPRTCVLPTKRKKTRK